MEGNKLFSGKNEASEPVAPRSAEARVDSLRPVDQANLIVPEKAAPGPSGLDTSDLPLAKSVQDQVAEKMAVVDQKANEIITKAAKPDNHTSLTEKTLNAVPDAAGVEALQDELNDIFTDNSIDIGEK